VGRKKLRTARILTLKDLNPGADSSPFGEGPKLGHRFTQEKSLEEEPLPAKLPPPRVETGEKRRVKGIWSDKERRNSAATRESGHRPKRKAS